MQLATGVVDGELPADSGAQIAELIGAESIGPPHLAEATWSNSTNGARHSGVGANERA